MNTILTILKKEFLETARDSRTLMFMVLVPLFIFPALFMTATRIQQGGEDNSRLRVGIVAQEADAAWNSVFGLRTDLEKVQVESIEQAQEMVNSGEIPVAVAFPRNFTQDRKGTVNLYYLLENRETLLQIENAVNKYREQEIATNLNRYQVPEEELNPFSVKAIDISTGEQKVSYMLGGIIPILFIIFGFVGCMYPAIDLFTGEKERGTLETLIIAPVSKVKILTAKYIVVVISGLLSSLLTITGLYLSARIFRTIPDGMQLLISYFFKWEMLLWLIVMLVPTIIFLAGIMIPIAIYSRNGKEAQSVLAPLSFAVLLPCMAGALPAAKLNFFTAIIPLTNVTLTVKSILADTISPVYLVLTIGSLVLFAVLSIGVAARWFGQEKNLQRM